MNIPYPPSSASEDDVVAATRYWLEKAVIGLNLCPFAKSVYIKEQVRFVVSLAETEEALQQELANELLLLHEADPEKVDTVLLIHPKVLNTFLEFNDFLEVADMIVETLGMEGEIQVASFHPQYQFANTAEDDMSNFTNRSPYPTLHLLREASIDRAVNVFPEASAIFEKNIGTMQRLGKFGWDDLVHDAKTEKD